VCITRKGDLTLRLPTNRGRQNHLFASSAPPQRTPHPEVGQTTRKTGLDPYTSTRCYTTTRRSNDPASAPEASQKPQRAQGRTNSKILTLQRMSSRPGDTTAASLTAGNTDTSHISFIHDRPSPPPRWDSTPHAPTPTLQQALDPTKNERYKHKRMARVARYHLYGEGHEQAGRRSPPPRWDPTPHTTTPTLEQHMTRQKTRSSITSTWPGLHDTFPSGKDTSRPALPESSRE